MVSLFLLLGCNLELYCWLLKPYGDTLRRLHRVLRARAPMMRALVMCARKLTQAHAKQRTSQQYSSNYSPEVKAEKPFKRKRKENDFDGKFLRAF